MSDQPTSLCIYTYVGMPDMDAATECPSCGFDALLAFPFYFLSASGVSVAGHAPACARCAEDER